MDPLSITATVLKITTSCISAAKDLNDIRQAWKRAPTTVKSLCSQLKLTAASLSQIQSLLLKDQEILGRQPELQEAFDTALTACLVLTTLLDKYMLSIKKSLLHGTRRSWKVNFKTVWNESEIKELLEQLHGQQVAIGALVSLLQVDSISAMKRQLKEHKRLLRRIAADTRHLRRTHAIDAPESVFESDASNASIIDKLADREPDQAATLHATFESLVLAPQVYKKTFTGMLEPTTDDQSDDTRTI
ncbi:hypothetical protein BU26DRAFT_463801, partial [Trematosphaeria pertusa]